MSFEQRLRILELEKQLAKEKVESRRLNTELIKLQHTFDACEFYLTRVARRGAKFVKQLERGVMYNTIKDAFLAAGGTMPEIVEPGELEFNQEIVI